MFSDCYASHGDYFKKEMCFIYGVEIFAERIDRSRVECAAYCFENSPCIWFLFNTTTLHCTLVIASDDPMVSLPGR